MEIRFGRRHAACLVMLMVAVTACAAGDEVEGADRDPGASGQALRNFKPPTSGIPGRPGLGDTTGGSSGELYMCFEALPTSATAPTPTTTTGTMSREQMLDRVCGAITGTFPQVLRDATNGMPAMTGTMNFTEQLLGALGGGAQCFPTLRVETDGQIAGVLAVVNQHEIEVNRFVGERAEELRARDYAKLMVLSHSLAMKEQSVALTRLGLRSEESFVSYAIRRAGASWLSMLDVTYPPRLDMNYLDMQVEDHLTALQLIDAMKPQAEREEVRCMLDQARVVTTEHLAFACEQRAALAGEQGIFGDEGTATTPTTSTSR